MQCSDRVSHRPYHPFNDFGAEKKPYIVRLAPEKNSFSFEWIRQNSTGTVRLFYRERGIGAYSDVPVCDTVYTVSGLKEDTEYEFYLEDSAGEKSNVRLVRTGCLPNGASVINYLHPEDEQYAFSGRYLCSPSLVRLGSGKFVAGMDVYANHDAQNLMILFASDDDGESWHYLTDLYPFYWGTLFVENGILYCIGVTTEYGNLQIACSDDGGENWSAPVTLIYGSNVLCRNGGAHHPPMQLVHHAGRIWCAVEYGSWDHGSHLPGAVSIPEGADLMQASNWTMTGFAPFEGKWAEDCGHEQKDTMEGNFIAAPDGNFYEYLRWSVGKALRIRYDASEPDSCPVYDRFLDMPVSNSMFRILPYQDGYLMVTNRKKEGMEYSNWSPRNLLSLFESDDLEHWKPVRDLVDYSDRDPATHGFQYPCVLLEGDTMYLSVRSGFNGAHSFHDSNYMLFFKEVL